MGAGAGCSLFSRCAWAGHVLSRRCARPGNRTPEPVDQTTLALGATTGFIRLDSRGGAHCLRADHRSRPVIFYLPDWTRLRRALCADGIRTRIPVPRMLWPLSYRAARGPTGVYQVCVLVERHTSPPLRLLGSNQALRLQPHGLDIRTADGLGFRRCSSNLSYDASVRVPIHSGTLTFPLPQEGIMPGIEYPPRVGAGPGLCPRPDSQVMRKQPYGRSGRCCPVGTPWRALPEPSCRCRTPARRTGTGVPRWR